MQEEYVKEQIINEKSKEDIDIELIKSIIKTKKELNNINTNYEFAEGELIDYYLYQRKAMQSKLDYLLKKAKKRNLVMTKENEKRIYLIEDEAI